jgi:hypothetical protein
MANRVRTCSTKNVVRRCLRPETIHLRIDFTGMDLANAIAASGIRVYSVDGTLCISIFPFSI